MHQPLQRPRDIPVVDERVFFNIETCIPALEIAGAIILHPLTKDQILRTRRGTNRVSLDKPHLLERAIESCKFGKITCDGEPSHVVNGDWHPTRISAADAPRQTQIKSAFIRVNPRPLNQNT